MAPLVRPLCRSFALKFHSLVSARLQQRVTHLFVAIGSKVQRGLAVRADDVGVCFARQQKRDCRQLAVDGRVNEGREAAVVCLVDVLADAQQVLQLLDIVVPSSLDERRFEKWLNTFRKPMNDRTERNNKQGTGSGPS